MYAQRSILDGQHILQYIGKVVTELGANLRKSRYTLKENIAVYLMKSNGQTLD